MATVMLMTDLFAVGGFAQKVVQIARHYEEWSEDKYPRGKSCGSGDRPRQGTAASPIMDSFGSISTAEVFLHNSEIIWPQREKSDTGDLKRREL
jgi:hypothetical protein